jgi:hypothetical protein
MRYLRSTQDSVVFLRYDEEGPLSNLTLLKAGGTSNKYTFADTYFYSCQEIITITVEHGFNFVSRGVL